MAANDDQLDDHSKRIRFLEGEIKTLRHTTETGFTTVLKLAKTVWGNGEPGMDEVQRRTSDKMDDLKTSLDNYVRSGEEARKTRLLEEQENRRWWKRTILGASIATIIATGIPLIINALLLYAQYKSAGTP